jgi:hypothetical protein
VPFVTFTNSISLTSTTSPSALGSWLGFEFILLMVLARAIVTDEDEAWDEAWERTWVELGLEAVG